MILGCHPGDCHYKQGNYFAQNRAAVLSALLDQFGIEAARFRLDWVSAGEGERFARVVTEMHEQVQALGPLGLVGRSVQQGAEQTSPSAEEAPEGAVGS